MEQSVALVAVENVAYHFDIFYSYTVPDFLKDKVQTGMRVMVPFGRSKTARRQGVVFGFAPVEQGIKYKDIISILDDEPFFICYADNLTNIDLSKMLEYHNSKDSVFTMALFESSNPHECGIVSLNEDGYITSFEEKPMYPKGNLANAGIYLANSKIFQYNNCDKKFCDFGFEILPQLPMYGWKDDFYLLDIGTVEKYEQAQKEVVSGVFIQ